MPRVNYHRKQRINDKAFTYYKDIVEQAQDIILVMRLDGKIIDVNNAAVTAYGYSLPELRNMHVHQLRPYKAQAELVSQLKKASKEGVLFRTMHARRTGEEFPVEVSSRFVKSHHLDFVVSIIRDITHTVAIEASLRSNEEKYRLLNEHQTAINEELTASEEELRQQFEELQRRDAEIHNKNLVLTLLHETTLNLMHRLDVNELLKTILTSATKLVDTSHAHICLIDEENKQFIPIFATGNYIHEQDQIFPLNTGLTGEVFKTGKITIIDNYSEWTSRLPDAMLDNLHCTIQIPLKSGAKVLGTLGISFDKPERKFTPSEIEILQRFAELASIGLDNATLFTSYKAELEKRNQLQTNTEALLNAIPDTIIRLHQDGTFLHIKATEEMHSIEDFLGKNLSEALPPGLAQKAMKIVDQTVKTGKLHTFDFEMPVNNIDSYFEARVVPCGQDECVAILRNVTDQKLAEADLLYLSNYDFMTGLYNRGYFEKMMQQMEDKNDNLAGIIVCDVDGLKFVNDTLGHTIGDGLLKVTAQVLRQSFSPKQVIARIGGDEFAIIMSGSVKSFEAAVHRIQRRISEYNKSQPRVSLSLSIGFAAKEALQLDMYSLFKTADSTMYREKLLKENSAKNAIIQGLVGALEARDFITEGHSTRLEQLIFSMATTIKLPEQSIPDLRLFAKFHDLGKVGIPDNILMKPGRLDNEEFAIMQQHAEIGYRIAKSVPDLEPIADLILKHHEWWNGDGYPFKLKGEEIPIECRMLAIADAYDAMTNDRPYRQALTNQEALAELKRCAGTQFDANLVQIFVSLASKEH